MSNGSTRCSHCHAELKSGRCEYCGTWADTNFLGQVKKSVGIHPALARRYATSKEPTATVSSPEQKPIAVENAPPGIPGYELLEIIGKGAMGSVYKAKHIISGRFAAVKILSAEMSSRADLVARFERESAALSSLRHPNVVAIYDVGNAGNTHYFCMEYLEGQTLRRFLKNGPMPLAKAIVFIRQILKGLKAAHDRGIIHRDLKPENVVVDPQTPRLVLVDFGLAGLVNEVFNPHPNLTRSKVTMGTVNYMAPEQHIDAKRVDKRSDLYSVAVIFYESILGDLPLGRFALPSERNFKAPELLDQILSKALSREPEKRYQTAEEFDHTLSELEAELERYEMPNEQNIRRNGYAPTAHVTQFPTQWASIPPWVKKPGIPFGILALAIGLILGFVVSRRQPSEVVVSTQGVDAVYEGSELQAFNKHWKSESPVWESDSKHIQYKAKQGNAGHFRRDLSFLIELDKLKHPHWASKIHLEKFKIAMNSAKAQHLARDRLGGNPETGAGGIFYVSSDEQRAVGLLSYPDGTCALMELKKEDGLFHLLQQVQTPCKSKFGLLRTEILPEAGRLEASVDGKPLASLAIRGLAKEKWQRALACRNLNCSFEPVVH